MVEIEVCGFKLNIEEIGRGKPHQTEIAGKIATVYKHKIKVTNIKTNGYIYFTYHGSVNDYMNGKDKLTDYDLVTAFRDWLESCNYGTMSFGDFTKELGYTDCGKAYNVWSLCRRGLKRIGKIGVTHDDLTELINALIEYEEEVEDEKAK